jgi:DNA-binding response OmpR family regulator
VPRISRSPAPAPLTTATSGEAAVSLPDRPVLLVVDDDDGVRDALHVILDDDYAVLDAADGRTALSLIRARRVDLVLLDILMPEIDGLEILRELRAFEPRLPVVMMTAVKTVGTAVAAMKLGAADYVTKPFQDAELVAAIRTALDASRLGGRATTPDPARQETRPSREHRFLLVDGDLGWRATLAVALQRCGRVETASALVDALNHVLRFRPTLIVLNVQHSAAEAARFLGAVQAQLPACPVLVLSDDPHLQAALAWETLNIRGLLRSPVDPGGLIGRIGTAVGASDDGAWPQIGVSVSRAIEHLGAHFGDDVSVDGLADVAGVSGSHLAHLFRAEIGMTVRDYLTRVRVEVARDLLSHTDETLTSIAAFVGFFDASHLSRVFRQVRGTRPSAFRSRDCASRGRPFRDG